MSCICLREKNLLAGFLKAEKNGESIHVPYSIKAHILWERYIILVKFTEWVI
jgi:hypothetical protein